MMKIYPSCYGVYLEIDQCEHCGGIWCDKYKLVSMKPDDVLIYYCDKCFEMWAPLQSLKRYKEYQIYQRMYLNLFQY